MAQEIKSKALDLALSQIEKQFGKGSIMKLGEQAIDLAFLLAELLKKERIAHAKPMPAVAGM